MSQMNISKLLLNKFFLIVCFLIFTLFCCKKDTITYKKGDLSYTMNGKAISYNKNIKSKYDKNISVFSLFTSPSVDVGNISSMEVGPNFYISNLITNVSNTTKSVFPTDFYSVIKISSGDQPYADYFLDTIDTVNNYFVIDEIKSNKKQIKGRFSGNYYLRNNYFNDTNLPNTVIIRDGKFDICH